MGSSWEIFYEDEKVFVEKNVFCFRLPQIAPLPTANLQTPRKNIQ